MPTFRRLSSVIVLAMCLVALAACSTPKGGSEAEQRQYITDLRDRTLAELYRREPKAREVIEKSAGYAVFSNFGSAVIFVSSGNGFGVVTNNSTGRETYMRMAQLGGGLGLGVRDFRAVFAFSKPGVMNDFVYRGWEWGAGGNAAARLGDAGGATSGAASFGDGITVYTITRNGVILGGALTGTKYWRDDELNAP